MGQHLDVALGPVEIRENERHIVIRQLRHVAAALLAVGREEVHELALPHRAKEFGGLRGELVVEFGRRVHNVVGSSLRARVAGLEFKGIVGEAHRVGFPEAFCLLLVDFAGDRNEILLNRLAELLDIVLVVGDAVHPVVAELEVVLVAELFAHLIAELYKLVIIFVELFLVLLVPGALGLPGGEAHGVVRVALLRGHAGEGHGLAHEGDLGGGEKLLVGHREVVLLLHLPDDLRREGLEVHLRRLEDNRPELRLEFRTEFRVYERDREFVELLLESRAGLVPVGRLRVVEFVPGVDRVADGGNRRDRLDLAVEGVLL